MNRYLCSICLLAIGWALAFAAALPGETAPPVSDLLILRSGAIEKGELKSYSNKSCQLGEKSFARDQIAWIGFSTANATPPAITDPAHDEVHLRDGTVQTGRLVSVNLTQVATEKSSYNRAEVAWIYLGIAAGGDWTGTLDFSHEIRAPRSFQHGGDHLEFKLDEKRDGSVDGTVEGSYTFEDTNYQCKVSTVAPGRVRARVTGTRTDTTMSLQVTDVVDTPPQLTPCLGQQVRGVLSALEIPQTANVLQQLVARQGRYHGEHSEKLGSRLSSGRMSWTVDIQKSK